MKGLQTNWQALIIILEVCNDTCFLEESGKTVLCAVDFDGKKVFPALHICVEGHAGQLVDLSLKFMQFAGEALDVRAVFEDAPDNVFQAENKSGSLSRSKILDRSDSYYLIQQLGGFYLVHSLQQLVKKAFDALCVVASYRVGEMIIGCVHEAGSIRRITVYDGISPLLDEKGPLLFQDLQQAVLHI
jgi:hypothetical protein